jgi:hypothetical protein
VKGAGVYPNNDDKDNDNNFTSTKVDSLSSFPSSSSSSTSVSAIPESYQTITSDMYYILTITKPGFKIYNRLLHSSDISQEFL